MNTRRKSKKHIGAHRKRKRFLYSNTSIVLFLIVSVFLSYQLIGLTGKRNLSRAKLSNTVEELERYQAEEAELRARIKELETEEGKERAIRERFNVVKENEGVVYVIDSESIELPSTGVAETKEESKETFLERLFGWFSF